jgi:hypothetical protein
VEYHDRDTPMRLTIETNALLAARPSLLERTPAFQDYIRRYPAGALSNTEDFFCWSKEDVGFQPVIWLTHVSIHTDVGWGDVMIATTQIYASHTSTDRSRPTR